MKANLEIFVIVDAAGDFAVGTTLEAAKERYTDDIGPLEDAEGFRCIKLAVAVPLPAVIEAAATIAEDEPAELAAA